MLVLICCWEPWKFQGFHPEALGCVFKLPRTCPLAHFFCLCLVHWS